MKFFSLLFLMTVSHLLLLGQNCSCIAISRNPTSGIDSFTGSINSKGNYSLQITKQVNISDTTNTPKYMFNLSGISNVVFTDSIPLFFNKIELKLSNNSLISLDSVQRINNQFDFVPSLKIQFSLSESQIKELYKNPIVTITVENIFKANFNKKSQKKQKNIFACMLN